MNVSNRPSAGGEEPPTAANNSQWGNNVKKSERIKKIIKMIMFVRSNRVNIDRCRQVRSVHVAFAAVINH